MPFYFRHTQTDTKRGLYDSKEKFFMHKMLVRNDLAVCGRWYSKEQHFLVLRYLGCK